MASMKAFAIPEILEMVLSQLPERDLLLDQRVNSTWQGVIKTSQSLRRKLFYTADLVGAISDNKAVSDAKWNSLLRAFSIEVTSTFWEQRSIEINTPKLKRFMYPTSSWKTIFLTQPTCVDLVFDNALSRDDWGWGLNIYSPSGVKLGDLCDTENWNRWTVRYVPRLEKYTGIVSGLRFLVEQVSDKKAEAVRTT